MLAAGHNSKKPVLVIATAESLGAAPNYQNTYTRPQADGLLKKFIIDVATTFVHALYHAYFNLVDVHNHLRQGEVSMADVWSTQSWADRHFAEGLGFWEVNVFKALTHWHPVYKAMSPKLSHNHFRVLLAHAMVTPGTVPLNAAEPTAPSPPDSSFCHLSRFKDDEGEKKNEKHQCGYCKERGYFYCAKCFPDGKTPTFGICSPNTGRPCFAKHCCGEPTNHSMHKAGKKRSPPETGSPAQAARARRTGAGPSSGPMPTQPEF
jgi:hypothetical protein